MEPSMELPKSLKPMQDMLTKMGVDVEDQKNIICKQNENGDVIITSIEGDTYAASTPSLYGSSTYALKITPPQGVIYPDGTNITFVIDGYVADQIGNWVTGCNLLLDLSAST